MKQVFRDRRGNVVVREVPVPAVSEGRVLVRVLYSVISAGTEARALLSSRAEWSRKVRDPSVVARLVRRVRRGGLKGVYREVRARLGALAPLGYSCAGRVVERGGGVVDVEVGDVVACLGAGYANHAEFVVVPRNLVVKLPRGVGPREGAFAMVGCVALHAVRNAKVELGDTVAVVGLGLIGQLVVRLLRVAGVKVVGLDVRGDRVEEVRRAGLVDVGVVVGERGEFREVVEFTRGRGVDAVVLCTTGARWNVVERVAMVCRDRARWVVVGNVEVRVPYEVFYRKELELVVSRSAGPGRYDERFEVGNWQYPVGFVRWTERRNAEEFVELVASGKVDVKGVVAKEYSLEKVVEAYEAVVRGEGVGVVLVYAGGGG